MNYFSGEERTKGSGLISLSKLAEEGLLDQKQLSQYRLKENATVNYETSSPCPPPMFYQALHGCHGLLATVRQGLD